MSLRYEENMDDLTEIAALYLSFPYTIAEIENCRFLCELPIYYESKFENEALIMTCQQHIS